jgi:hypothetical protein
VKNVKALKGINLIQENVSVIRVIMMMEKKIKIVRNVGINVKLV